ncbi:MAG TPA: LysR substrate-binding domain-containing protein [Nevskiaceae bacterium]|nr:LysR substrate-binding domain-containing protein [Nevskiaceae bacterium]
MNSNRLPPLNALRAFEAVARNRSFRKAADELFVTPAAVTHQIKQLEEQLGIALFERKSRGIALTPAASAALPRFRQAFELMSQGVAELRGHGNVPRLSVRATPTFMSRWLMPRMQSFLALHPNVELHLLASDRMISPSPWQTQPEQEVAQAMTPDIDIQFSSGPPAGDIVDLLLMVDVVPMCNPALLKGAHPLREPDDLRHHTLLHADGLLSDRMRSTWALWLQHAGARLVDPRRGMQFDHSTLALEAAADGLGVTLAMPLLAAGELERGEVKIAFAQALPLGRGYYSVISSVADGRPEVAAFRQWLQREAADTASALAAKKEGRVRRGLSARSR